MKVKRSLAVAVAVTVLVGSGVAGAAAETPANGSELAASAAGAAAEDVGISATDAPLAVRVGAASTVMPITVITGAPVDFLEAGVVAPDDTVVGYGVAEQSEPGRPRVFKPEVEVLADELTSWGPHAWVFIGDTEDGETFASGGTAADVRAHSILGLAAARTGSSVAVRGSLRAYNPAQDRYAAWSGQAVSVQRQDGNRWVQVRGLTTDVNGNISTSVSVPRGSTLRLVVKDSRSIWGAVSRNSTQV